MKNDSKKTMNDQLKELLDYRITAFLHAYGAKEQIIDIVDALKHSTNPRAEGYIKNVVYGMLSIYRASFYCMDCPFYNNNKCKFIDVLKEECNHENILIDNAVYNNRTLNARDYIDNIIDAFYHSKETFMSKQTSLNDK